MIVSVGRRKFGPVALVVRIGTPRSCVSLVLLHFRGICVHIMTPYAQRIHFEPEYLRSQQFLDAGYSDKRVAFIRSKVKPQSSWLLHLAGDHHQNFETKPLLHGQHMMRCMLTANLALDRACFRVDCSTAFVRQERAKHKQNPGPAVRQRNTGLVVLVNR